jgi:hypothetical protein
MATAPSIRARAWPSGKGRFSLTVADLGNGHADIVTADEDENTVSVLLGNGDGTFGPAQALAVGGNPYAVAVANLGNGQPDIVFANSADNTVSVLLGNGNGTFQSAQSFVVGNDPESVAVADLDNGHPDIVTANYVDNTVSVLLGDGDSSFRTGQTYTVGPGPFSVAVADLGNGRPDIIAASRGVNGTISVLLNEGQGQFQAPTVPSGIPSRDVPQLQDLTGDGIPDAVSLDQQTGEILIRQGTGDPNNPYQPFVIVNPRRPAVDFTLVQTQELPEIAALDAVDQKVLLYAWSSATGQFQQIGSFATGPDPVRIASADLDGNGLGDVVVANDLDNTLTIALQQAPGIFTTFSRVIGPGPASSNRNDLFSAFTRNVGAGPSSISFADLSGDGLPDIVVSDQISGDVTVLFNDASHSFTTQERYRAGQGPFDVNNGLIGTTIVSQLQTVDAVAGDFTGMGSNDVAELNVSTDSFMLLRAAGYFTGRAGILDLRVTNAGGQIATLPGIGSDKKGSGFFGDNDPRILTLDSTIVASAFDPRTGAEFVVLQDGSLRSLGGAELIASGVVAVSATDGVLIAGLADGDVEVMTETGDDTEMQAPDFIDQPSALQALLSGNQIDVYASYQG